MDTEAVSGQRVEFNILALEYHHRIREEKKENEIKLKSKK